MKRKSLVENLIVSEEQIGKAETYLSVTERDSVEQSRSDKNNWSVCATCQRPKYRDRCTFCLNKKSQHIASVSNKTRKKQSCWCSRMRQTESTTSDALTNRLHNSLVTPPLLDDSTDKLSPSQQLTSELKFYEEAKPTTPKRVPRSAGSQVCAVESISRLLLSPGPGKRPKLDINVNSPHNTTLPIFDNNSLEENVKSNTSDNVICIVAIPEDVDEGDSFNVQLPDGSYVSAICPDGMTSDMFVALVASDVEGQLDSVDPTAENRAYLKDGLGKGMTQKCTVNVFWHFLWQALKKQGWTKVKGVTHYPGAILFYPPNSDTTSHLRVRDNLFFRRIRDILTLVSTSEEYKELHEDFETRLTCRLEAEKKRRPSRSARQHNLESWKYTGSSHVYEKHTSRVGGKYQVAVLPEAGSYISSPIEEKFTQIWDAKRGQSAPTAMSYVIDGAETDPYVMRDARLEAFHKNDYNLQGYNDVLASLVASRRDAQCVPEAWTDEDKEQFQNAMINTGIGAQKNLAEAASQMEGKTVGDCLWYYYHEYKSTDEYLMMKEAIKTKHDPDQCMICLDGGELMGCESCENCIHLRCHSPPLKHVPEDAWYCTYCKKTSIP
mmetsp:Transcript_15103/g.27381  ORF Transcript_15103/g.27381 Transcript_15103/m.27381 type:complete len:607 (-) Transcript_15103:105-1925(-)